MEFRESDNHIDSIDWKMMLMAIAINEGIGVIALIDFTWYRWEGLDIYDEAAI